MVSKRKKPRGMAMTNITIRQEQAIRANAGNINADNIESLVERFLLSQDVKQSSKVLYRRTMRQYLNWINKKGYDISRIARPQIIEYKEDLLAQELSSLTVGSYLVVLRKFYAWAEANLIYPNVANGIKTPYRKQQFKKQPLRPEQATALLNYYHDKAKRDYAIVNLLLRTGLRTIEVIRAQIGDITIKGSTRVLLVQGKGRDEKDNFVILTEKTYEPIEEYLKTRGRVKPSDPLFISESNNSKGEYLTTRTISHIAKEGLKAIGLDERAFTAHSLRHTTATNILRAGGSLEMVQLTLRHRNPATTQIYTEYLNEERRLQDSGEALIDGVF